MIKAIFIDLDNTLVANQYLYDEALAALCGYLRHFGVLPAETKQVFDKLDKELFKIHGYSRERMPASFEAVLKYFAPNADAEMVTSVRAFAEEIFNTVARMKPGSLEAMKELTANYPVYIVTAGDKGVQQNRISHLPFKNTLSGAFVVEHKDKQTFSQIAAQLGLKPEEVVMIGDSLKSDVIAPVEAGMLAVWIEDHNSSHEAASGFPEKGAYQFSSLLEAARHIVTYKTPAPIMPPPPKNNIQPPRP